jgi:hypothetical protein
VTAHKPAMLLYVVLAIGNLAASKASPPFQQGVARAAQPHSRTDEQAKLARRLREYLPQLKEKTSIPPRLITYFPRLDKADDLYVNVISADSTRYEIVLAFDPDCLGQNVCGYGILVGTTLPFNEIPDIKDRKWVPVTLAGGIKARYYDTQCYAYCSYSMVAWSEGKWRYLVELKAERKWLVIKAANSALAYKE